MATRPASILIVEDEPDLAAAIHDALGREGFEVTTATTGAQALAQARAEPMPDLVLLDMTLPDMSGTEVCKALRGDPTTRDLPVVIISARVEEIDRVVGLEVGADDFIAKPFSLRELVLRVRAILRRSRAPRRATERITRGRVSIDEHGHRAWLDDREVAFTALEFRLLLLFMQQPGRVHTREALLSEVWGINAEVTTRTVDTHVLRLRDKLGPAADQLQSLRGVGYRFTEDIPPRRDPT
jgi:two-component system, OmpR family, phosphate regulon response regulator PhoB